MPWSDSVEWTGQQYHSVIGLSPYVWRCPPAVAVLQQTRENTLQNWIHFVSVISFLTAYKHTKSHLMPYRVPTLLMTKNSTTFAGLSRTVKMFFQDLIGAHQCLNIKTNSSYLLYIQGVIQCTKFITNKNWKETAQLHLFTHGALYIWQWRKQFRSFSVPAAYCPAPDWGSENCDNILKFIITVFK